MKKFMKKAVALTLAMSFFLTGTMKSEAAFNDGSNSKKITYGSATGNISILADVSTPGGGVVRYKYKGTTYLSAYVKMKNTVSGYYYDTNRKPVKHSNTVTQKTTTVVTAELNVPSNREPVCNYAYKCNSTSYINDNYVGAVSYPY